MSGSNPFRRKQDIILGLDIPAPVDDDDLARADARFPALQIETIQATPKTTTKRVRIVSPHSSTSSSSSDDEGSVQSQNGPTQDHERFSFASSDSVSLQQGSEESPVNPFQAGSESEDTAEENEGSPRLKNKARVVPEKARTTLAVDSDNPWRTSTLIDNLPQGVNINDDENVNQATSVPIKAQRTLGLSEVRRTAENENQHQYLFADTTQGVPFKAQKTLGIPSNPFQKTPASTDDGSLTGGGSISRNPSTASNRTPMDMDAFKRLLLTGDQNSPASSTLSVSTLPIQYMQGDSSSNTDASSLSRQSILDSYAGSHLETPRTSHEIFPSDDEQHHMREPLSLKSERHGTPSVQTRNGYQPKGHSSHTVTFMDQQPPQTRIEVPQTPATYTDSQPALSPTNLNKPLPPPPASPSLDSLGVTHTTSNPIELPSSPNAKPRTAPAPPLSRRHSQLRSKFSTSLTGSKPNSIIEEPLPVDRQRPSSPSTTISSKPPAPPPPRRRASNRSSIIPEKPNFPELPAAELPDTSVSSLPTSKLEKQRPPVPPTRSSSVRTPTRPSPSGSISAIAPPPPPPRRRGSSSSGYSVQRRPSAEVPPLTTSEGLRRSATDAAPRRTEERIQSSADVISKAAAGSVAHQGESHDDIMQGLERLKQEVDALRGRYEVRDT